MGAKLDTLMNQYKKLMEESHKLSKSNRREADSKFAQAQQLLVDIERAKQEEA